MTEEKNPSSEPAETDAGTANPGAEAAALEDASDAVEAAETALTQSELAKRVDALGGDEDAIDRLARDEEAKLAERRGGLKKKTSRLADDAHKRLEKVGTKSGDKRARDEERKAPPRRIVTDNPWLERLERNRGTIATVAVVGIAVLVGGAIYQWRAGKQIDDATLSLVTAFKNEHGEVGDPEKLKEELPPDVPMFKTPEERRDAALQKYTEASTKFAGTGAGYLAQMFAGSLQLDKRDADAAIASFTAVKGSPLAAVDKEVKGRALEGLGFAYELKGQKDPKFLDEAVKVFKELQDTDAFGFRELGTYHQARVYELKGDKDKAKELLKTLRERLHDPTTQQPFERFLETAVDDRLRALDPTAVPPKSPALGGMGGGRAMGGGGKQQFDPEQIKKMIESMKNNAGGAPHP
ncbi:MAG: hypothetical protein KBF88_15705 [Polyangiaceae bacterium]|nr:hypothetical protein [Polyangiaceae bacterium]